MGSHFQPRNPQKRSFFSFFSKSSRNLPKTWVKKLSKAYARFSEGPGAINDVQCNTTSLLLIFNKNVVFRQQMLFFHQILYFYMNETSETWKNNICCWKTTFLLKIGNNDAMLLLATIIASGDHDDNSRENQLSEPIFSKNLRFRQFLQIDFELHMCFHVTDLSNVTNWQHIGRRPSDRNFCRNFCLPPVPELEFHLWRQIFVDVDKINNFQQQNNKCCF